MAGLQFPAAVFQVQKQKVEIEHCCLVCWSRKRDVSFIVTCHKFDLDSDNESVLHNNSFLKKKIISW